MNSLGPIKKLDLTLRETLPLVRISAIASLSHRTDCRLTKLFLLDLPIVDISHHLHKASLPQCHPPLLRLVIAVLIAGGYKRCMLGLIQICCISIDGIRVRGGTFFNDLRMMLVCLALMYGGVIVGNHVCNKYLTVHV
jgi:hypothetical protein